MAITKLFLNATNKSIRGYGWNKKILLISLFENVMSINSSMAILIVMCIPQKLTIWFRFTTLIDKTYRDTILMQDPKLCDSDDDTSFRQRKSRIWKSIVASPLITVIRRCYYIFTRYILNRPTLGTPGDNYTIIKIARNSHKSAS